MSTSRVVETCAPVAVTSCCVASAPEVTVPTGETLFTATGLFGVVPVKEAIPAWMTSVPSGFCSSTVKLVAIA